MKVGDYVRTKSGYIGKITSIDNEMNRVYYYTKKMTSAVPTQDIVKYVESEEEIINLIEVGDYVNGCIVINKKDDTLQIIQLIIPFDLKEKDIKSMVTKEQFESMEYKVGE